MNAPKQTVRFFGFVVLWLSLVGLQEGSEAGYKVVLKDGKVMESRTKPVSIEGHYRFTDSEGQFYSIPVQLVDVVATQSMNAGQLSKSQSTKVLTNEDLSAGKENSRPVNTVGKPEEADSKIEASKNSKAVTGTKKGEAYWRGRAKQLRDEIESVDKQLKALNEKTQSGKSDGIKIGFETYNSVIYADFESQAKELEKRKEKLQKMMVALEEEARKEGALPGWLR